MIEGVHLFCETNEGAKQNVSVLIGGKSYKQKSGLAMGNNLALFLAMIYMNEVDFVDCERNGESSIT